MGGLVWPRDQTTGQEAWFCPCFPLLPGQACSTWGLSFPSYKKERVPQGPSSSPDTPGIHWVN